MSKKKKNKPEPEREYDPKDKYEWGKGNFSVILEPHETKGLTNREIVKLMDERSKAMEQAQDDDDLIE